jgi:hypothetical protein
MGLVRGYKMLKELHTDGRCNGYITTIIAGNNTAVSTIAQSRAGLPDYKDMGECRTYAVSLNKRSANQWPGSVSVRFAQAGEEVKIVKLLSRWGKNRQFFPALTESDFGTPLLRGLAVTQFIIAEQDGKACGVAAIWDQTSFKQYRIKKYSRPLRLTLPLINAGLKLTGYNPLPKEGQQLHSAFLCFKAAENNSPEILSSLLRYACSQMYQAGFSHCILGFHADDPAKTITDSHPATVYLSRLYFAGWKKEIEVYNKLDGRIPYFDPAIL